MIPPKVQAEVKEGKVFVTGEKGKLQREILPGLRVEIDKDRIVIRNAVPPEQAKLFKRTDALHGLMRTLVLNMVQGAATGFEKILEIHGVGYKAEAKGKTLSLLIGFSHPVELPIPDGVQVEIVKNTILFLRGFHKETLGNYAATVRAVYPPEPYKGTGIRYRGEYVRQKVGKAAVGAAK